MSRETSDNECNEPISDNLPRRCNENESSDWCFPLPELPKGKEMVIRILSTWGDRYYVGLTGIEIFIETGERAKISKV